MSDYVFKFLKAVDELKGERCPGEARCTILRPELLDEEQAERDGTEYVQSIFEAEERDPTKVCPECHLYRTKPGREPPAISLALYWAFEHDTKRRQGYTPKDLSELTAMQWAAWRGLLEGQARWKEVLDLRMRKEAERIGKK